MSSRGFYVFVWTKIYEANDHILKASKWLRRTRNYLPYALFVILCGNCGEPNTKNQTLRTKH